MTSHRTNPPSRKQSGSRALDLDRFRGRTVLVVDDFGDSREMYAEYLEHHGFRVAQAADGRDAMRQVCELQPDLVVMDLSLPEMDGWEATASIRANATTRTIPILAVTGHALGSHAERALAAGCDDVLTKPLLPEDLLRRVLTMLGERS